MRKREREREREELRESLSARLNDDDADAEEVFVKINSALHNNKDIFIASYVYVVLSIIFQTFFLYRYLKLS